MNTMTPRSLPQDAALPQLPRMMDTQYMHCLFETRLRPGLDESENNIRIRDCTIERVKYKPGKNCMVCYQLTLENLSSGKQTTQRVCGRIYTADGSRSRFIKARDAIEGSTPLGFPVRHFDDMEMVLWLFPHERKLHSLPRLVDPDHLRRDSIEALVKTHWDEEWSIDQIHSQIIHYAPEHNLSLKVKVTLHNSKTSTATVWVIYGKHFYNDNGEETLSVMKQLHERSSEPEAKLTTAKPLGYQSHLRLLWQESLPGEPLNDLGWNHPDFFRLLEQTASVVASLHQTPVNCRQTTDKESAVRQLYDVLGRIGQVVPSYKEPLSNIVEKLENHAHHVQVPAVATLHGDLHLKNILTDKENIFLIDLDSISQGSPLFDVGSFVAGLIYRGRLHEKSWEMVKKAIRTFLNRYQREVPWQFPQQDLDWHIAAALIGERVHRCLSRLKPGRLELIDDLITYAVGITNGVRPWEK